MVCILLIFNAIASAQYNSIKTSGGDDEIDDLLNQYLKSKGNNNIVFDSTNIKQYWTDKSVASLDGSIAIVLENGNESKLFPIQIVNVNESQDCKIDIITDSPDLMYCIADEKSNIISVSSKGDDFINFKTYSAIVHMEDIPDFKFNIKFMSSVKKNLSIKKIVMSFSNNKSSNFLSKPFLMELSDSDFNPTNIKAIDSSSFSITGRQNVLICKKKIIISNGVLTSSVKIKNIGNNTASIYIGYAAYTKKGAKIDGKNFPFRNNNRILNVIADSKDTSILLVDSYSEWTKNCFLAINAAEDMSDIPNTTLLEGRIVEFIKNEDGTASIVLDKKITSPIPKGSKLRIHGLSGAYIYTNTTKLQPGEEEVFSSQISRDENILEYTSKAFSRGVYYVVPIILSYSTDSYDNTVLISDFSLSY